MTISSRRSPTRRRTSRTSGPAIWSTSRSSIRGRFGRLKLWLAFRAHGAQAFRDAIEDNLRQARLLYELVLAHDALEPLCGPPPLSIVPFRHIRTRGDLNAENARLVRALQDDGRVWVAPATIDDKVGLRPCLVNFRTTDADVRALVEIAVELGARLTRGVPAKVCIPPEGTMNGYGSLRS